MGCYREGRVNVETRARWARVVAPGMFIRFARRLIGGALLTGFFVGHADAAPLEDVKVTGFNLASSAELSRYWAAMDRWHRALFPEMPPPSATMGKYLPTLRIAFQSKRQLFDPLEDATHFAKAYLCGARDRNWGIEGVITADILWQGRVVDQQVSQQIAEQLRTAPTVQEYEVFFEYAYWDPSATREKEDHIELLPLPDDICLTFQQPPFYAVSSTGELFRTVEFLRISKKAVNEAVGDLPRLLAVP